MVRESIDQYQIVQNVRPETTITVTPGLQEKNGKKDDVFELLT